MATKLAGNNSNTLLAPSGKCWALLKQFEGLTFEAKPDTPPLWQIGYGHTIGVRKGDVCGPAQALAWLFTDTANAARTVRLLVTAPLNRNQFDALTCLVFNIGSGAFHKSHLLAFLNSGQDKRVAQEWLNWDHVDGQVVDGLAKRRQAELQLFCTEVE